MKLLNPMQPYNLFGIEDPDYEKAKVVVLPIPYDSTVSYKVGSREGPHQIIEASRSIEFYSEEFDGEIKDIGIFTLEELAPHMNGPKEMVERIEKEVTNILDESKFPLLVGGEHTIMIGAVKAIGKKYKDFSVIHFDAHSDYRDEFEGSKYSHACVMARAREVTKSCYSLGVRSIDTESAKKYGNDILYRKDMYKMTLEQIVDTVIKRTKEKVYITIDLDVLDPSIMPSLGTPEPDGLDFHEITTILKGILAKKELIGIDFNELCPIPGFVAPNYLVAKLIYLTLGYAFYKP